MVKRPLDPKKSNDVDYVPAESSQPCSQNKPIPQYILDLETNQVEFSPLNYTETKGMAVLPTGFFPAQKNTELMLFNLFFNKRVLERLRSCTNKNANRLRQARFRKLFSKGKPQRQRPWTPVTLPEIKAWLGIQIQFGLNKLPHRRLYWNLLGNRPLNYIIRRAMSQKRFEQIDRFFHIFDEAEEHPRPQSISGNRKLAKQNRVLPHEKASPLAQILRNTFKQYWLAASDVGVDESIMGFYGRSAETVTIPGKPTPTGHKVWILADSGYVLDFRFHTGGSKSHQGPQEISPFWVKGLGLSKTQAVVIDLMTTMIDRGVGHCVWLDNLFTSYKLLSALRDRGIGAAGTSRTGTCITQREKAEEKAEKKAKSKAKPVQSGVVKPKTPKRRLRNNHLSNPSQTSQDVEKEPELPGNAEFQFIGSTESLEFVTDRGTKYFVRPPQPMPHLLPYLPTPIDPRILENQKPSTSDPLPSGSGMSSELTELKLKYGQHVGWGRKFVKDSPCKRIVQFAWKDASMVLFQSTVGDPSGSVERPRKRPSNGGKNTDKIWGDSFVKILGIPQLIDHYNHRMNAVDVMDQIRSYYITQRKQYKTWRPLFTFLLEASLSNAWKIAENLSLGQSTRASGHYEFRTKLSQDLVAPNTRIREVRKRGNQREVEKTPFVIWEDPIEAQLGTSTMGNHCKGTLISLGKPAQVCQTCQKEGRTVSGTKRKALGELSVNSLRGSSLTQDRRAKRPRSTYGCSICHTYLCRKSQCWENHFS
jgi:hypothetical protein